MASETTPEAAARQAVASGLCSLMAVGEMHARPVMGNGQCNRRCRCALQGVCSRVTASICLADGSAACASVSDLRRVMQTPTDPDAPRGQGPVENRPNPYPFFAC